MENYMDYLDGVESVESSMTDGSGKSHILWTIESKEDGTVEIVPGENGKVTFSSINDAKWFCDTIHSFIGRINNAANPGKE